jgi:hypothetical protein
MHRTAPGKRPGVPTGGDVECRFSQLTGEISRPEPRVLGP